MYYGKVDDILYRVLLAPARMDGFIGSLISIHSFFAMNVALGSYEIKIIYDYIQN